MGVPQYTAGGWTGVVTPGLVAVVGPEAAPDLVLSLWESGADGVVGARGVLVRDGFRGLPPFALVSVAARRVHLAVRGPVEVIVETADGTEVVRSGEVSTWSERVLDDADAFAVRVVGATPDEHATWWPVADGVVPVDVVQMSLLPDEEAAPDSGALPHVAAPGGRAGSAVAPVLALVPAYTGPTGDGEDAGPADVDLVPTSHRDETDAVAATATEITAAPADAELPDDDVVGADDVPTGSSGHDDATDGPAVEHGAAGAPAEPPVPTEPAPPVADPFAAAGAGLPPLGTDAPGTGGPAEPSSPSSTFDPAAAADEAPELVPLVPDDRDDDLVTGGPATPSPWSPGPREEHATPSWASPVHAHHDEPGSAPRGTPVVTVEGASPDDHDGLTVLSSELAAIREQLPTWTADPVPGPFAMPTQRRRPPTIVLSTGLVVEVDRPVLLGRAPQVERVANRELPRLVTVPSPQQDISRTHAEVRVEGDQVLVTDLDSTNGVFVTRASSGARRLRPGEPSAVGPDEVVDLGDGVTFTVERGS